MTTLKIKWFTWQQIVIMLTILVVSPPVFAQTKQIKGIVLEVEGRTPLPRAIIMIKGSKKGFSTNSEGVYSLDAKSSDILVFSFLGFISQEVLVGERTTINITLSPSAQGLDEVVVIGYGSVDKVDLTGSVGSVNLKELSHAPVSSFTEALAGRIAGVQVSSNDGQPGEGSSIVIRGPGTLTQSTAPLYVIDGFPMEDFDAGSLNNNDIESINILKDASATAIYGSRGANGVVMIETKKGKVSKPIITVNSSFGFNQVRRHLTLMEPYEFVKLQYELTPIKAETEYFQNDKTLESYKSMAGIDWQDEVLGVGPTAIHNLAIRGGSDKTKYSISGSIYDQEGVVKNTWHKRYQGSLTLDQAINDKLRVGINANYSNKNVFGKDVSSGASDISTFLFYNMWGYRPIVGDEDFDLLGEDYDPDNMRTDEQRTNPLRDVETAYNDKIIKDFRINADAKYAINKDLTLNLMAGLSGLIVNGDVFNNSRSAQGNPNNPRNIRKVNGSINYSEVNTWSSENILTYKKELRDNHRLTAMSGFSMQGRKMKSNGVSVGNVPNEVLGISGLDEGLPFAARSSSSEFTLASFFGRLNYNYNSKYIVTATFRGDGSSKFAEGKKWGYFPSAAIAWNMVEEKFMNNIKFVSNSKIRTSYGITGNNRVNDFAYLSSLTLPQNAAYSYNNADPTKGIITNELGNPTLKWEVSEQFDLGYDLGLFNNRIELTADVYRKTTRDLLLDANIPYTSGFSKVYMNIGKIKNEGLEVSLNTVNIKTKEFKWGTNFNISFNRNEVLELAEGEEKLFSFIDMSNNAYESSPLYVAEIGQSASMFYGYVFDGVYQFEDFNNPAPDQYVLKKSVSTNGDVREQIKPGDIKYKDLNNDGVVDTYDQAVIGRGLPIHTGGIINNFNYKGFDLSVFFQWAYGHNIYNANRLLLEGNGMARVDLNQYASYINRWTPENPSNSNFRAGGQGPLGRHSSRVIEDGSYLRLKTLSFGYTVPAKLAKKAYFNNLRLTVSAQNLFTWTKYSGMDPEVSVRNSVLTNGFDYSAYPHSQTIVMGLNASF